MSKPKIDKAALLKSFKADLKAAEELKYEIDSKIEKRRHTFEGRPYGNEEVGKSKIVPKVAKRQSEWAHASIKDPFVSTPDIIKCSPITYEDVEAARQAELLLNYQFCRQFNRYNFITKAIKVLDVEATLVVQTGWEYEDEEVEVEREVVKVDKFGVEYLTTEVVTETKIVKNQPTAKICRSEDIYIDPTCQDDLDKAQFIVYRYETDMSSLRKDGRYKNLDKVAKEQADDNDYESPDTTEFKFQDDPRKKIVVYEYWGNYDVNNDGIVEQIVCAWVGNTIIRLEDNPYPDGKPPFLVVPYSSVPFQLHGENNIDLIADHQQIITAVTRGIINNMAASTNGQVGILKGTLDATQRKKFFAGKNFEFNQQNGIWQGSYNPIPNSAFNMLEMMNNEVESLTGIKGFSGGISGNTLGSSATAARGVLDATSVRRLDLVRNLAENLIKPLMRKWMAYNAEFLSEEEVIRVTNGEFVEIRRDDLDGNIDIDITISTAEDNAAKSQELSFLLQTLGNTVPFELTQKILARIAKLSRQPDLEQDIKTFKPEPDPLQEQLKQLEIQKAQMELEKLAAEIEAIRASSREDLGDEAEKLAAARLKDAQTKKLLVETSKIKSEKDLTDLKFIKEDEQATHKEKLELEQLKNELALQKEALKMQANQNTMRYQAEQGDSNIGVMR
jgi:hypothetical protein